MLAAARLNWRLWTIIQSELLDPMSTVPLEVRSNVLSLSRFIDAKTVDFVAEPLAGKLDPLIAINRELASGLYASANTADGYGAEADGVDRGQEGGEAGVAKQGMPAALRLSI